MAHQQYLALVWEMSLQNTTFKLELLTELGACKAGYCPVREKWNLSYAQTAANLPATQTVRMLPSHCTCDYTFAMWTYGQTWVVYMAPVMSTSHHVWLSMVPHYVSHLIEKEAILWTKFNWEVGGKCTYVFQPMYIVEGSICKPQIPQMTRV